MWRTLEISELDWQQTPQSVQTKLVSAYLEAHCLKVRSVSYQKQINLLHQPAAQLQRLNEKIVKQQLRIDHLQKQLAKTNMLAAEVAGLTAEVAALKEKLGQNSRNSSLPPFGFTFRQTDHASSINGSQKWSASRTSRGWTCPQTN